MLDLSERVRDFVDTAEPPVTLSDVRRIVEERPTRHRRSKLTPLAAVATLTVAAIVVVSVFALTPRTRPALIRSPHRSAAVQLQNIALSAGRQPAATPNANQWLQTEQTASIAAYVSDVGNTPTPNAKATIDAKIGTWSDTTGQACISATTDPAQFASPDNEAAWTAAGLIDQPTEQPITGCDGIIQGDTVGSLTESTGVIDVSTLPVDSTVLARALDDGTTGIPAIDDIPSQAGTSAAFTRAVILLMGPDSGATPAFESALYGALATIPGIQNLGSVRTHSGGMGAGFSAATSSGVTTIVVDPATGALLEAQNVADQSLLNVLAIHYLSPHQVAGQGIGSVGGSYGATILWLDPVGKPMVVGPVTQVADGDSAIYTIARADVSFEQLQALGPMLQHEFGGIESIQGGGSTAEVNNPNVPPATTPNGRVISIGATNTWTFIGSSKQIKESLDALAASGLFVTILVF